MKTAREKILLTANRLFYKYGIHAVGVDEIVRQSGVTKMTLYKHFGSKDGLAEAYLKKHFADWRSWFTARLTQLSVKAKKPQDHVLFIFDALEEWFETPEFRGCPLINTVSEISDRKHPVRRIAVAFKNELRDAIANAVKPFGGNTADLAEQILMLVDGAIVRATMIDSSAPAKIARKAAAKLLENR